MQTGCLLLLLVLGVALTGSGAGAVGSAGSCVLSLSPAAHLSKSLPGLWGVRLPEDRVLLTASLSEGSAGMSLTSGLPNSHGSFLPYLVGEYA